MKKVKIYTDGSCLGNPGPGGWAAVLLYKKENTLHEKCITGGDPQTTNNQMEMMAAVKALQMLKETCIVELFTDSEYMLNGFTKGWVQGWKNRGWSRKKGQLMNIELWQELDSLNSTHKIEWIKVKAHAGNKYNELCDRLAKETAANFETKNENIKDEQRKS
jgi:ribonuclease HI